jgi:hypothetical protein
MMSFIARIVSLTFLLLLAKVALATNSQECSRLREPEGETSNFPPYQVELKIFDCAGMIQDILELDALDRDIMVMRARNYPLDKLQGQLTKTDPPRKYSDVTSVARLAKLKKLVETYYRLKLSTVIVH